MAALALRARSHAIGVLARRSARVVLLRAASDGSGTAASAPPSSAARACSPVERDYQFLTAALDRRRELADRYEMDKADGRTGLEKAEAVAARVGLKMPRAPAAPTPES